MHVRLSDLPFVLALIVITLYSAHSFYLYLFPDTFEPIFSAVENVFLALFGISSTTADADAILISSRAPKGTNTTAAVEGDIDGLTMKQIRLKFHTSRLDSVTFRWPLLMYSLALFGMLVWSYWMALTTPPGYVPSPFHQRRKKSSVLSLASFFEPLPFPLSAASHDGNAVGPHNASLEQKSVPFIEKRRHVYPGVPRDAPATHIRIFSSEKPEEELQAPAEAVDSYPDEEEKDIEDEFFFNPNANAYTSLSNRFLNFCPICLTYKPPRTHHCSYCRTCVLKYDHHCPWIGQCVGFFNYKNFLLLLVYTWLITIWALSLLLAARIAHWRENQLFKHSAGKVLNPEQISEWALLSEMDAGKPFFGVYVCFCECFAFFIMSTILLKRHLFLARRNLTTIESLIKKNETLRNREDSAEEELSQEGTIDRSSCMESMQEEPGYQENLLASKRSGSIEKGGADLSCVANAYDLGLRRNLLQIFGDAKVPDRRGIPHAAEPSSFGESSCHCYEDLLEGDEFEYPNFAVRWFWRLVPIPAYAPQRLWDLNTGSATDTSRQKNEKHSIPNYGSFSAIQDFQHDKNPLLHFNITQEHLLGLRFPTRASLEREISAIV